MVELEADPDVSPYILEWDRDRHRAALADPAFDHRIVELDGERVGIAVIADLDSEHRNLEVRRIAVTRRGEGVGRRALELAVDRAFEVHGAHRVWLDLKPDNERAKRSYRALGFVEEGIMRESLWSHGEFESMLVMSVLEHEWAARRAAAAAPDRR